MSPTPGFFPQMYTHGDGISRNLNFKIPGKIIQNFTLFVSKFIINILKGNDLQEVTKPLKLGNYKDFKFMFV